MNNETTGSLVTPTPLRDLTINQFIRRYNTVKEHQWAEMGIDTLEQWEAEVKRRGHEVKNQLLEAIGEVTLPHERWLIAKLQEREVARRQWEAAKRQVQPLVDLARKLGLMSSEEDTEDRRMFTRLANDPRHPMTLEMVDVMMSLPHAARVTFINGVHESQTTETAQSLPEASMGSGETSTGKDRAPGVVVNNSIAQQSIGVNAGAPTTAESGFDVVAYRRLPLVAKRDAFIDNGFLYVRSAVLKSWLQHLTQGRCCRPQRENLGHHASDCWIRDAVR